MPKQIVALADKLITNKTSTPYDAGYIYPKALLHKNKRPLKPDSE